MRVKSNFHFKTINTTLKPYGEQVEGMELMKGSWETYCSNSNGM